MNACIRDNQQYTWAVLRNNAFMGNLGGIINKFLYKYTPARTSSFGTFLYLSFCTLWNRITNTRMSTFLGFIEEIPGISVDRFDGKNLNSMAFFLSHCHSDHMIGLNDNFFKHLEQFKKYLYCSRISKVFLESLYNLKGSFVIKELDINSTFIVEFEDENNVTNVVSVSCISAGHCPGSIMFLFEKNEISVLYTGDFRLNPLDFPKLKCLHIFQGSRSFPKKFSKIYLDTTFLDYHFSYLPSRQDSMSKICEATATWLTQDSKNVVVLECSALYGAEFLFIELSKSLKRKIHVKNMVYENYRRITELAPYITNDPLSTPIHACMSKMSRSFKCFDIDKKNIMTIVPSVFKWKGKNIFKIAEWDELRERTFNVCYSTHSSFNELKEFIQYFDPMEVFPCVCPKGEEDQIYSLLKKILNKSDTE